MGWLSRVAAGPAAAEAPAAREWHAQLQQHFDLLGILGQGGYSTV